MRKFRVHTQGKNIQKLILDRLQLDNGLLSALPHTLTHTHTHPHSHTLSHTHTITHTHTHSHTLTHSHTHTLTHTHTHTHTHTLHRNKMRADDGQAVIWTFCWQSAALLYLQKDDMGSYDYCTLKYWWSAGQVGGTAICLFDFSVYLLVYTVHFTGSILISIILKWIICKPILTNHY